MNYYSGKDLARGFSTVRKNTIEIAREIPEDQYGFRATPDTRSVAETLRHIAGFSRWQHQLHAEERKTTLAPEDFGKYMQDVAGFEATLKTKADILTALEHNGSRFSQWLENVPEAELAEFVKFAAPIHPSQKTRFEMLLGVKEHEMHHRAQLMVIQRMIGLVPHLTRARQTRQAPAAATTH